MFKVKDIVRICNGKLLCGNIDASCKSFSVDTRTIKKNDAFVGIKGSTFNGNLLYLDAIKKGAILCIVEEDVDVTSLDIPIIRVNNSIKALQDLARSVISNFNGKVIGVTGSVGKTSTKDMIYSVVSTKYKVLRTIGNNNNHIGLPLSILRYSDEDVMILEMGMNNFNEISMLTNIARPDIGIITNIGTAHIGNLGSRENILKAKLEITEGLKDDGILLINNDNDLLHDYYLNNKSNRINTIGINNLSDYMAKDIRYYEDKTIFKINDDEFIINTVGSPFVYNALIAYYIGVKLDISIDMIRKGIENFSLTNNRLEVKCNKNNITIIDDTYNASYDSVKVALEVLKNRKEKRKIAVLGDILELGKYSNEIHKSLASLIIESNIDILVTVGSDIKYLISELVNLGYNKEVYLFDKYDDTYDLLDSLLKSGDVVLFKASHGIKLNEVVNHLMK